MAVKEFNYEPELTEKLDELSKNNTEFTRSTFDEITLWKVSRYPHIDDEIIEAVNNLAQYNTLDEAIEPLKKALRLLLEAKGVRLAMASTYLRFRNPQVFQIIDQRVYRQVYKTDLKVPHKIEDQIELYVQYLRDLRLRCIEKGKDFFSADRVFYLEDRSEGNTVDNYGTTKKQK
jgi:hypothetical protein